MAQQRYLVAGPLRLDRDDERLWCDGNVVRLGGKAVALLRVLMERPRTLVTKDELLDTVWPDVTVSESVLTTAVKELRRAISDDARQSRFIETVHGRGYRFLLDTEESDGIKPSANRPSSESAPRSNRTRIWLLLATFLLVVAVGVTMYVVAPNKTSSSSSSAPHTKSIAVMPFADMSPSHDQAWFAAGLGEEILNSLARTPDLHVAARTSASATAGDDAREIGRRLNVAHILEGSVRHEDGRVRVTAQLIRTSDGFHLWSQNFDRSPGEIISIQEDIAVAIASALKTVMSPGRLQAMVRLGTRSVEAYEQYLKALALEEQQLQTGDTRYGSQAYLAYERARTADPQFAAAHWSAAQYWFGRATRVGAGESLANVSEEQRLREYLERLDAAIATSGNEAESFKYRSARALTRLQLREAMQFMRQYLRRHPRDLSAWDDLVDLAGYVEDRRLMAIAAERIHSLSVESGSPRSRAITASVLAKDIDGAVVRARQQLAMSPNEAMIQYQAHRALLWGSHRDEARAILKQILASSLPAENKLLAEIRQACADGRAGTEDFARRIDQLQGIELSSRWNAALMLGQPDRATELLRPLDSPDRLTTLVQYLVYPSFDARPFPLLQATLRANGIRRPAPEPLPYSCNQRSRPMAVSPSAGDRRPAR